MGYHKKKIERFKPMSEQEQRFLLEAVLDVMETEAMIAAEKERFSGEAHLLPIKIDGLSDYEPPDDD